MSTIPTPASVFANRRPATAPAPARPARPEPARRIIADLDPEMPAKSVRPGMRRVLVEVVSDGVVKAKHLKPGQQVRAFAHGQARGSLRTVKSVTRVGDGAMVHIEWESAHPAGEFKAAYRWYDAALDGTVSQHVERVPGFVAAH